MLMGSTQGASLSIAHDGAFYGATTVGLRWTRPALYKLFKDHKIYFDSVKIKATNIFACPPTCLPTTPASRSDAHQTTLSDAPAHTIPQHSYDLRYTSPYSLFRDVDVQRPLLVETLQQSYFEKSSPRPVLLFLRS